MSRPTAQRQSSWVEKRQRLVLSQTLSITLCVEFLCVRFTDCFLLLLLFSSFSSSQAEFTHAVIAQLSK